MTVWLVEVKVGGRDARPNAPWVPCLGYNPLADWEAEEFRRDRIKVDWVRVAPYDRTERKKK